MPFAPFPTCRVSQQDSPRQHAHQLRCNSVGQAGVSGGGAKALVPGARTFACTQAVKASFVGPNGPYGGPRVSGLPEFTQARSLLRPQSHGGGQGIVIDCEKGNPIGGSDPRKDGCAIGY